VKHIAKHALDFKKEKERKAQGVVGEGNILFICFL
jgi:hypothetical protein